MTLLQGLPNGLLEFDLENTTAEAGRVARIERYFGSLLALS